MAFENRRPRVFIDTSVLIAGFASATGASAVIRNLCEAEIIEMVISEQVLVEADRNFKSKFPHLIQEFRIFIKNVGPVLVANSTREENKRIQKIINAKDAPILAVALREKVDFLVTLDKDFCRAKGKGRVEIVTPGEFLRKSRLKSLFGG